MTRKISAEYSYTSHSTKSIAHTFIPTSDPTKPKLPTYSFTLWFVHTHKVTSKYSLILYTERLFWVFQILLFFYFLHFKLANSSILGRVYTFQNCVVGSVFCSSFNGIHIFHTIHFIFITSFVEQQFFLSFTGCTLCI